MAVISILFIHRKKIYILPAAANLIAISAGLGLMRYGYFLRYGFTLGQTVLLWLPAVLVILAVSQVVCTVVLLVHRKSRVYIPLAINAALSAAIVTELLPNVLI